MKTLKRSFYLLTLITGLCSSLTIHAQITPYKRKAPFQIPNKVGTYGHLKNATPWNGQEPGSYSIKVKIKGLKPKDTLYLVDYYLDGKYMRDTAVIQPNGIAEFTDNELLQRGFYLLVMPKKDSYFDILVDDDQDFTIETDTSFWQGDYYSKMNVTGSQANLAYRNYERDLLSLSKKRFEIENALKTEKDSVKLKAIKKEKEGLYDKKHELDMAFLKANPDNLMAKFIWANEDIVIPKEYAKFEKSVKDSLEYTYYKSHYWDNIDLQDNAYTRMPTNVLKTRYNYYFDKLVIQDPDSLIKEITYLMNKSEGAWEIEKFFMMNTLQKFQASQYMGHDKVLVYTAMQYYATGKAWWTDSSSIHYTCSLAYDMAGSIIGSYGPPVELRDTANNWVSTENIPAKYTFMVFWDPTCGHCREVIPKLGNIQQKHLKDGWVVVAMSTHDHEKEWKQFLKEHPETKDFIHLRRGEVRSDRWADNYKTYYVYASPTIFILDANRKIIANKIDVEKIEEFLKAYDKLHSQDQKPASGSGGANH